MDQTETKKHYWLYVLLLNEGKYYIGKTSKNDPYDRIDEHLHKFYSAQWVKKYGFLDVKEVIDLGQVSYQESENLELERTLQYMKKYGYNNVRGGSLTYRGDYRKIGDRFYTKENFNLLIGVSFMTFALLIALVEIIRQ